MLTIPKTSIEHSTKPSPLKMVLACERAMINIKCFRISGGYSYQFESYVIAPIFSTLSVVLEANKQKRNGQIKAHAMLIMCHTNMTISKVV